MNETVPKYAKDTANNFMDNFEQGEHPNLTRARIEMLTEITVEQEAERLQQRVADLEAENAELLAMLATAPLFRVGNRRITKLPSGRWFFEDEIIPTLPEAIAAAKAWHEEHK